MISLDSPFLVMGVDPGLSGAVVVYGRGVFHCWRGFKTLRSLSMGVKTACSLSVDAIYTEHVHAWHKQGVNSVWSFGESTGVMFGAIFCSSSLGPVKIQPLAWQNWVRKNWPEKIPFGLFDSRVIAEKWFSSMQLKQLSRSRSLDHNACDAALIAAYGHHLLTEKLAAAA